MLQCCRASSIRLSTLKTRFGLRDIVFGGHCITKGKYRPEEKKVDAIRRATLPRTVGELMRFLGALNWIGKYCPLLARRTYHLRKHLRVATSAPIGTPEEEAKTSQRNELLANTKQVSRRVVIPFKRKKGSGFDITALLSRRSSDRLWEFPNTTGVDSKATLTGQSACARATDEVLVNTVGLSRRFFTPAELPRAAPVIESH